MSDQQIMADKERTYSISQIAREFDVTPRALRFYEDKGLLTPGRDGLNRVYTHRDRGRLQIILRCKCVGLSLIEIREVLDLYKIDERTQAQTAIKKFRTRLKVLEKQRADIDAATEMLHGYIAELEGFVAQAAPPGALGAVQAYEQEAKRRMADAH
jgi:DNA-binding transcriptional MerR regulator